MLIKKEGAMLKPMMKIIVIFEVYIILHNKYDDYILQYST